MIRRHRGGRRAIRLDLGLTLLALEPVDLIPQPLVLVPQFAVVRRQRLHQVEQLDDGLSSAFNIVNRVGIKTFEHRMTHLRKCLANVEHRRETRPCPVSLATRSVADHYLIRTGTGSSRYREFLR